LGGLSLIDPTAADDIAVQAAAATGTIGNDDTATLSISAPSITETDADQTVDFTVTLDAAVEGGFDVAHSLTLGSAGAGDLSLLTASPIHFAGNTGEVQTIQVQINGDTVVEDDETFTITLGDVTSTTAVQDAAIGTGAAAVGTITNDDPPLALYISDVTLAEGDSGNTSFNFLVTLSSPGGQLITVGYATVDGTATGSGNPKDYNAINNGTLTFAPGEISQPITVDVVGDADPEIDETFFVNLSNPSNAVIADSQGVGTIVNDDAPPIFVSIDDVSLTEGDTGTSPCTFTVTLSAPSAQTITVDYATADDTATGSGNANDYNKINNGTLTFDPGVMSQQITVNVVGDSDSETDETFFVNLSNPSNGVILDGQGVGTIVNDDAPPIFVSIDDVSLTEGDSGTTPYTFTATLSAPSSQTITVDYATDDSTATSKGNSKDYYKINKGTLTFAPGETSQTITVNVVGDATIEPNETFFVNLSNPTNALLGDGQGLGTILDDDGALRAIAGPIEDEGYAPLLTKEIVSPIVRQAVDYWRGYGLADELLNGLNQIEVYVTDLPRDLLGMASANTIWLDHNAAGYGWSIAANTGGMDLLSAVTHELGHVLGYKHSHEHLVMLPFLSVGGHQLADRHEIISNPGQVHDFTSAAVGTDERMFSRTPWAWAPTRGKEEDDVHWHAVHDEALLATISSWDFAPLHDGSDGAPDDASTLGFGKPLFREDSSLLDDNNNLEKTAGERGRDWFFAEFDDLRSVELLDLL
jgi:hypothetical protein